MAKNPPRGPRRSNGRSNGRMPRRDVGVRPVRAASTMKCRLCQGAVRSNFNYCPNCSLPVDPSHDHPLFVVEGLTNLFNVVFFESLLEQELNRASRYGHEISVIVAEIDALPDLEAA